jgi:hypothetical protein
MIKKFFLNQMGNNLDAYRAAIGLFHACKMSLNIGNDTRSDTFHDILITNLPKFWRKFILFLILLILILHMDMDLSDKISTALNGVLDM